jgi:glycosyltransferase involved in cell wall biosynthesis
MKLIIQIPCFNEAATLPVTLAALPRELPGVDTVEWLVIDDGSTDDTAAVARAHGVDHIVRFPANRGLAAAFVAGLGACLERGADLIVNTDADNQYNADDIPKLIDPIVNGSADMVIGARPIMKTEHFSPAKKLLQKLGSWAARVISKTRVDDAPSGFRAFGREAAMQLNVFSSYTYTLETIIQAGLKGLRVESVPIRTNEVLRPSRLVKSIPAYVRRSMITMVRIFIVYRPFRFFMALGTVLLLAGLALGARFVVYYLMGEGTGKVQSLILAAVLLLMGFQTYVLGVVADIISVNRKLLEDIQLRLRRAELDKADGSSPRNRAE